MFGCEPVNCKVPAPTLINRSPRSSGLVIWPLMISMLPASTPIRQLPELASSIGPLQVLVPLTLRRAPSPSALVPLPKPTPPSRMASGSAIVTPPVTCNCAPAWTCVSPVVAEPNAVLLAATRMPWRTSVMPW